MGESNGIDVLIKIKAELPHIKVLLITAHQEDEIMNEAFYYGACDFILKPFKASEILDLINKNLFAQPGP